MQKNKKFISALLWMSFCFLILSITEIDTTYAETIDTRGTIGPILIDREKTNDPEKDKNINVYIKPGEHYFSVRIVGAAVSVPDIKFLKGLFSKASQVTMTSSATVPGIPNLPASQNINWIQDIKPGLQYSLGVRSFLVNFLPA